MPKLDHLTVIAQWLGDGLAHVSAALELDPPFGVRHDYMGAHNHRLRLGDDIYLEIVALDPGGRPPGRPRWFGRDDSDQVEAVWADGRRLRGWVAATAALAAVTARHPGVFGEIAPLPPKDPSFAFSILANGA